MKIVSAFSLIFTFCILCFTFLISSCSVQSKINQSAKKDVLKTPALQTAHVGISIYEPATGKYWYDYNGEKYFVPASNVKIPTCYAAMKYLGDSLVGLKYIVEDSAIEIQGTGDPTFLHRDFISQPILIFLKKFKFISLRGNSFFENYWGSGWAWSDYTEAYMAQRSGLPMYGNIARFEWKGKHRILAIPSSFQVNIRIPNFDLLNGFALMKPLENNEFIFSDGDDKYKEVPFNPRLDVVKKLLEDTLKTTVRLDILTPLPKSYIIYSQPTDSVLRPMMHRSDNFFAEQLLLMVSNERLGVMNDEKIIDTILKTDFSDLPQKPRWEDGSGLSRYNLFTPKDMVAILNKMKNEFGMQRVKNIFPTGGEGTLSNYYIEDSNYIYAKTGSLSGVVALSGYLYTRKGKELIFSVLVNNHQASGTEVRKAVEKFLQGVRSKL